MGAVQRIGPGEGEGPGRALVLGLGCSSAATAAEITAHVAAVLAGAGIEPARVRALATLDTRAAAPAVRRAAEGYGWPVLGFPAAHLAEVAVPHPGDAARAATGTASVAEAAALLAARGEAEAAGTAELVVPKRARGRVTAAVARGG